MIHLLQRKKERRFETKLYMDTKPMTSGNDGGQKGESDTQCLPYESRSLKCIDERMQNK